MRKPLRIVLFTLVALALVAGGVVLYQTVQRNQVVAQIEQESPAVGVSRMTDLGTTQSLEILPLVEKESSSPQLQAEHGVSYLIKTDHATILLDMGYNIAGSDPSLLQSNMAQLGASFSDIDTIVISHWHPDHVGGTKWWTQRTFSPGNVQVALNGQRVFVPSPMSYPGLTPVIADQPARIAEGVATIGTLPFVEVINLPGVPVRNTEQALVVNVASRGIVLITGCGHPTLPRLVARAQAVFAEPVVGVIGGLHLTGAPAAEVQADIDLLKGLQAQLVGLSPHDSDTQVINTFRQAFPGAYQEVSVGKPIRLGPITTLARLHPPGGAQRPARA